MAVEIGALEVLGILGLVAEGIFVVGWVGALDFLGALELGVEGIFVVGASRCHRGSRWSMVGGEEGFGGYLRFREPFKKYAKQA